MKGKVHISIVFVVAILLVFASAANAYSPATAGEVTPIPPGPETVLPEFIGAPAKPHPLPPPRVPQNPSLGPNPFNHDHNDTWMSDTYEIAGPLGRDLEVLSSTMAEARRDPNSPIFMCPGAVADSQGRLVLSCTGPGEWSLVLVDPETLEVLAFRWMPVQPSVLRAASASYLYVDNRDQVVVPVVDEDQKVKIQVLRVIGSPGTLRFEVVSDYDISAYVAQGDNINGVLPDWQGRIWFVVRASAAVGVLDPATGSIKTLKLNGAITNSFAMDRDAAYIVTTEKMYRIEAGPDGAPRVVWEAGYQNSGAIKPGQLSAGSGTTPTILGNGKYVAITDNAEQLNVVVYRTEAKLNPQEHEQRIVCEVPVFKTGAGADENSLIGSGLSLIAYTAYGYDLDTVFETFKSMPNGPGIARVDIDPNGKGCKLVWENDDVSLIDSVAKMSTRTGLVYAVTRKYDTQVNYPDPGLDVYYFSAIDVRTGKVVWERQMGTGFGYDTFGDLVIGPSGTAYMPQYGGLVAVRDTR